MTAGPFRVHEEGAATNVIGDRLLAKVVVDQRGCWIWQGKLDAKGYGRMSHGKYLGAHRVSYDWFVGPIPDGYEVDHLCFTPACINPAHLEAVTPEENQRRALEAGRFHLGRWHGGSSKSRHPKSDLCPCGAPVVRQRMGRPRVYCEACRAKCHPGRRWAS